MLLCEAIFEQKRDVESAGKAEVAVRGNRVAQKQKETIRNKRPAPLIHIICLSVTRSHNRGLKSLGPM